MRSLGDVNSQVDVWENCSRVITPGGTGSPLLEYDMNDEDILRAMMDIPVGGEVPTIPPGMNLAASLQRLVGKACEQTQETE